MQKAFLHESPFRTVVEALVVGTGCLFVVVVLAALLNLLFLWVGVILTGGIVAALCAVRLRPFRGRWWQKLIGEGWVASVLSLLLLLIYFALQYGVGRIALRNDLTPSITFSAFILGGLTGSLFLVLRVGIPFLMFWNRLRQSKLIWELVHTHLMVVALIAFAIILVLSYISTASRSPEGGSITLGTVLGFLLHTFSNFLPYLLTGSALAVFGMLIVLPPSALISYLFARRVTRRLEALAAATSALRCGDYAARVPVSGEDEIAQLQADFNTMATQLEQAVDSLKTERDRVTELLQARRQLVANVSHELRTPVATLRGYLESALHHWSETQPPTLHHDLEVMERETVRLQALIDDLFTLSRVEVGNLALHSEPADAGAIIRRSVDTLAPLAWQTNRVEMVAEVPADLPQAEIDADRFEQIIYNLLRNALRHTPPGGIVAAIARANPDAIVVEVRDTGEGIPAEDVPHIFDRFYRADTARSRESGGAGLGLALVKELTEAMDGTVSVVSTPGEGSCFTLRLKRACTEAA